MQCDVIITAINNNRAFPVLARHLAHDPNIPLAKAQSMLTNLPIIYMRRISGDEARFALRQLEKLGVVASIAQSSLPESHKIQGNELAPQRPDTPQPDQVPAMPEAPVVVKLATPSIQPTLSFSESPTDIRFTPFQQLMKFRWYYWVGGLLVIALCAFFASLFNLKPNSTAPTDLALEIQSTQKTLHSVVQPSIQPTKGAEPLSQPVEQRPDPARASQSDSYSDSATTCNETVQAIRFFKLALSFNKNNIEAWQGLINAYEDAQEPEKAHETRIAMEKLLGKSAVSAGIFLKKFGTVRTIQQKENGTLDIFYDTHKQTSDKLQREAYTIVTGLKATCNCAAISLYARTPDGAGYIVFIPTSLIPHTYNDFTTGAHFTLLQSSTRTQAIP